MARIIYISGGCRSGKSKFAIEQASKEEGPKIFLATCPRLDDEMSSRIERHKKERIGWETIEEETQVAHAFTQLRSRTVVVLDCLSLWINNLMYRAEKNGEQITQDSVQILSTELGNSMRNSDAKTIFVVTSEVGMGLVPENKIGRLYRDILGICNQTLANFSEEAYFLVSGIPILLKSNREKVS
ncbi:bifunctional adenosylcobinamide kinase/adenosylcobinamide-phosphate guanylyltransferase [Leptospira langatensis]|uniref:Adenosylcobinamide kinase n=1 Tax=Leptospira langatensis TaxID=2484983 RepID=A0A5F1ZZC9_9LEPT|nr:bifunctional adenosylcobinamide kinase/adenosylcobinamide-phosphate guanylyltransferase [Leptospira langatensis]TGJ98424.1 bifunctional adenosylcobinamide kinase/adenosylcobinamide-phosphate guanylyltransferase [Leptospira langatensis]TGL43339.1 bifunctional adenosylcobinamide kinase/adenosylcobinamide-phosphate guanylyltransferase [Leptospira langatensis]